MGERIRAVRHARGLSQAALAKVLGIKQSHVSNIERGVRSVTISQITKLSRRLGVPSDQILGEAKVRAARSLSSARLLRRLQRIEELPREQQRAVLKILDGLLDSHSRNGRR